MTVIYAFLAILLVNQFSSAQADVKGEVRQDTVFSKAYNSQYSEGQCGQNIKRLLALWYKSKRSLTGVSVVVIENRGGSVFGMVNAERARSYRFDKPVVDEKNWYHHVIAVDEKGFVYDYDFMTKPYVMKFKSYLYYMFLDEPECKTKKSGEFCGGAKNKMQGYRFTWISADDYLFKGSEEPYFTGNMSESLKRAAYLGR